MLRFKPFKIYPKLPTLVQVRHDAFWTSIGMLCATLLEAAYCWGVANNKISAATTLAEAPFTHLVKKTLFTEFLFDDTYTPGLDIVHDPPEGTP